MAVTKTGVRTLAQALNSGNAGEIEQALGQVDLGMMLAPLKVTVAGAASAAAQNITTLSNAVATVNQGAPSANPDVGVVVPGPTGGLPPILSIVALRITAGTAVANVCVPGDAGATPSNPVAPGPSVVSLSDDGTTITFGAAVTGFVIEYIPRPSNNPATAVFAPNTKA